MLEEPMIALTALDRCDRCVAQAYVQAEKENCSNLLFCLHHIRESKNALLDQGWTLRWDADAEDLFPHEACV